MIGAGIAGLAAASELRASGFGNVVVLEARDRVGGRIWTQRLAGAVPVDLGASWIHGVRGNPIADLARRSGIETRPTDWDNAVLHFHERAAPMSDTLDLDGFWTLAETRPRTSLRSILDEYLETHALTAAQRRYLEHLLNTTVEHEYGADLTDLSLDSVDGGSEYGGSDVLFPGGYGQIVEALSDGLEVRLRQAVTAIDHSRTQVVATTASGARFEADRVVVTLPLGVLKNGLVSFSPPLPPAKRQAIADLKMGVLNKTCLLFEDVFWEPGVEAIGYVGADKGQWAETLSLHPYTGQPVLMMFNAAAYGTEIERLADREIVAEAVAALAGHVRGRAAADGRARHALGLRSVDAWILFIRAGWFLVRALRGPGQADRRQGVFRGRGNGPGPPGDCARGVSVRRSSGAGDCRGGGGLKRGKGIGGRGRRVPRGQRLV